MDFGSPTGLVCLFAVFGEAGAFECGGEFSLVVGAAGSRGGRRSGGCCDRCGGCAEEAIDTRDSAGGAVATAQFVAHLGAGNDGVSAAQLVDQLEDRGVRQAGRAGHARYRSELRKTTEMAVRALPWRDGRRLKIEVEPDLTYCLAYGKTWLMFHDGCSTNSGARNVGGGRRDPAGAVLCRWHWWRAQLTLRGAAADGAAEAEFHDGCACPAVLGQLFERSFAPAVAMVAVETERVLARDQIGDGVQVDGVHARSVACGGLTW